MGGLSYRDAGVDIDAQTEALRAIGPLVRRTMGPRVLHELGAFGGMFDARFPQMESPVLVATTDSVGTKVRLGTRTGRLRGLGHDIVNHCVNDALVQGAEPLFFLDYFAASKLEPKTLEELVAGMVEALEPAGAALLGGETAEMPGTYAAGELDLVGFLVGVVDRARVWPRGVAAGDVLVGVRSDGLHTNGYSIANRLVERDAIDLDADPGGLGESAADALLRPHRSYLPAVRALGDAVDVHALCHVTGGGLVDNLPRVLPDGVGAEVDRSTWQPNPVFGWLVDAAGMDAEEPWRVFNMGVGLVVVVAAGDAERCVERLCDAGEDAWRLGRLVAGERRVAFSG